MEQQALFGGEDAAGRSKPQQKRKLDARFGKPVLAHVVEVTIDVLTEPRTWVAVRFLYDVPSRQVLKVEQGRHRTWKALGKTRRDVARYRRVVRRMCERFIERNEVVELQMKLEL